MAYLRIAIHFPQNSQASDALRRAADLEKNSNPEGARRLYQEIQTRADIKAKTGSR